MIKKSRARHCEKNLTDIVFPTACKLSSQTLLLCLHLRIGEKDWRLPFWMLFQLKLIIMRACAVAVLLVTLTHIAVDAGFLTSLLTGSSMLRKPSLPKLPKLPRPLQKVGMLAKEQHIDPHIDYKIDVMLDFAPTPDDATNTAGPSKGYNGTGISGAPRFKAGMGILLKCGECSCTFPLEINYYGPQKGCTTEVRNFTCSCKTKNCYMDHIKKCLENMASGKCQSEGLRSYCL
ncbi:uncharacterized protein LOC119450571 isoform X1 [Dermacentor silvarum]|uniref:uncharacterized protein LOC119450571 isoform X1 n=1 Tax=Dermacentor silvarum TaxID=543639 RepID=UPI0018976706|nr:uncharacterized protein LOC119450571 isoform X1 [Dermacentor silvarum]